MQIFYSFAALKEMCGMQALSKCDVIRENLAYGGANYVFLHFFIKLYLYSWIVFKILQMNIKYCDKKSRLWSDIVQNVRCLIRAFSFCPFISWFFPRWRHKLRMKTSWVCKSHKYHYKLIKVTSSP